MGKHVITATIYNKAGKVLSRAVNDYNRTHPIQAMWAARAGMPARIYLHAEIAALVKLRENDRPYRMTVERYTKDGKPALAASCPVCLAALKHYKIVKVEHTV